MKLIKLSDTHYIVVDDSEIKENSFIECERKIGRVVKILNEDSFPYLCADGLRYSLSGSKVVIHSTQPLEECGEELVNGKWEPAYIFGDSIKRLPLSEVQELIYGYSIEKMARNWFESKHLVNKLELKHLREIEAYHSGFKAHQELVKDKLFTVEDIKKAIEIGEKSIVLNSRGSYLESRQLKENFIQSLIPKTEWNIEFDEQGKIKLI